MTACMCHNGVGRAAYAEVPVEIEDGKGFLDKIEVQYMMHETILREP
ncbi:hypothetical protein Tco_0309720, partial [Tanacetum coccineum]